MAATNNDGNPQERADGVSRAVHVGPFVTVGGTGPIDRNGNTSGIGDPVAQVWQCFEIMLTNIDAWTDVAAVRKEYFEYRAPTDTIVEVQCFPNPDCLVEIQADAIVANDGPDFLGDSDTSLC